MYQKLINSDSLRHSEGNDSFSEERIVRDSTQRRAVSEELSSGIVNCGTHWECIPRFKNSAILYSRTLLP